MKPSITQGMVALILAVGAAALASPLGGCSSCQREEVNPQVLQSLADDRGVALEWRPTDAERDAAARLVSQAQDGRFPERVVSRPENARLFLLLAAKSDRAEVTAAALRAMHAAYGDAGGPPGARPAPDADDA
jgi:hypothetical protein